MNMDLSAPSLRWMSYQATAAGLRVQPVQGKWNFEAPITIHESLAWYWQPFEVLPWVRLKYHDAKDWTMRSVLIVARSLNLMVTYSLSVSPHLGMPRRIHEGQMLHSSLLHDKREEETVDSSRPRQSRLGSTGFISRRCVAPERPYQPMASLKHAHFSNLNDWNDFYSSENTESHPLPYYVERDLHDLARELVDGIRSAKPLSYRNLLRQFVFLASSGVFILLNIALSLGLTASIVDGARALRMIPDIKDLPSNVVHGTLPLDAQNHIWRVTQHWVIDKKSDCPFISPIVSKRRSLTNDSSFFIQISTIEYLQSPMHLMASALRSSDHCVIRLTFVRCHRIKRC